MKYLVKSGHLLVIVTAKTPEEACHKALDESEGQTLGHEYFYVYKLGEPTAIEVKKILAR